MVITVDPLEMRFKATRMNSHSTIVALAVGASPTASEHVFSPSGLVATETRYRLNVDRAADIVFLHESLKHELWKKVLLR